MEGLGTAFVAGAIAGYGVAIPVGAISILIIETAIRRGFRIGAAAGAGAATADGVYATLAALAGAALAALIGPYERPLKLLSAVILVVIAVRGLLALRARVSAEAARAEAAGAESAPDDASGKVVVAGPGITGTYARFVGLTIINPTTVVYFAALILGLPAIGDAAGERVAFVVGAFLASISWQLVVAAFGAILHHRLPPIAATVTSVVGNVIVLLLALNIALSA